MSETAKNHCLTCQRCGQRVGYLWRHGRIDICRGCAARAGLRTIYPGQAARRHVGRTPFRQAG